MVDETEFEIMDADHESRLIDNIVIECWACKTDLTVEQIEDADGNCPECDSEIDLEFE